MCHYCPRVGPEESCFRSTMPWWAGSVPSLLPHLKYSHESRSLYFPAVTFQKSTYSGFSVRKYINLVYTMQPITTSNPAVQKTTLDARVRKIPPPFPFACILMGFHAVLIKRLADLRDPALFQVLTIEWFPLLSILPWITLFWNNTLLWGHLMSKPYCTRGKKTKSPTTHFKPPFQSQNRLEM